MHSNNWEGFVMELKSEFNDDNSKQQYCIEAFLYNMVQQIMQQQDQQKR